MELDEKAAMSSLMRILPVHRGRAIHPDLIRRVLLVLLTICLGVATAYLTVRGQWRLALGLIAALPVLIVLHRYPWASLLIWFLLVPFLVATDSAADRQVYWVIHRALPPAMVGMIIISTLLGVRKAQLPRLGWAELSVGGYIIVSLAFILLLSKRTLATTYHFYDHVFVPICLYLIVRLLRPGQKEIGWLVYIALFVVISQTAIGLISWLAPSLLPSTWLGLAGLRTTGSLRSPAVYSTALIFCGLLALHAGINRRSTLGRLAHLGTFALALVGVFMTFSRGSWLGGSLVLLGVIYLYPGLMLRVLVVAALVATLLGGNILADQLEFADQRLNSTDTALSRLPVYYAALRMFQEKPLFGWGYLNFDIYDREYQGRVGDLVNPVKDHTSHNEYLTILAEQGLIGLGLFLTPVLWWLVRSVRVFSRLPKQGYLNRRLLISFWLVVAHYLAVSSFSDIEVVFALGLWWITLGFIGSLVMRGMEQPGGAPA
jgi:O-antigen ligase